MTELREGWMRPKSARCWHLYPKGSRESYCGAWGRGGMFLFVHLTEWQKPCSECDRIGRLVKNRVDNAAESLKP